MNTFGTINWNVYYGRVKPPPPPDPMADWPCKHCEVHPMGVRCKRHMSIEAGWGCRSWSAWKSKWWGIVTGRRSAT